MNNNGFTLIELLAVIVILAIVLLISVPMVLDVIKGVKFEAFKNSAKSIIKSAEIASTQGNIIDELKEGIYEFDGTSITNGTDSIPYNGQNYEKITVMIDSNHGVNIAIYDDGVCIKGSKINLVSYSTTKENCKLPAGVFTPHYFGSENGSEMFFKGFQKSNGNYILMGHSTTAGVNFDQTNHGDYDGHIMEVDQNWNVVWRNVIGGPGTDYTQTGATDGTSYIISGNYTAAGGSFSQYRSNGDSYIAKYSDTGTQQWIMTISSRYAEGLREFVFLDDGTIIGVGHYDYAVDDLAKAGGTTVRNYMLIRIEADGSNFTILDKLDYGNNESEWGHDIIKTSDGGYLVSAASQSNYHAEPILIKYNASFQREWLRRYSGTSGAFITRVIEVNDGYVLGGHFNTSAGLLEGVPNKGSADAVIIKVDFSGTKQWATSYGGAGFDGLIDLIESRDGGFIAVGLEGSIFGGPDNINSDVDATIYKFDSNGNILWNDTLGGTDYDHFTSVIEKPNGDLILIGSTKSNDIFYKGSRATKEAHQGIIVEYSPFLK